MDCETPSNDSPAIAKDGEASSSCVELASERSQSLLPAVEDACVKSDSHPCDTDACLDNKGSEQSVVAERTDAEGLKSFEAAVQKMALSEPKPVPDAATSGVGGDRVLGVSSDLVQFSDLEKRLRTRLVHLSVGAAPLTLPSLPPAFITTALSQASH